MVLPPIFCRIRSSEGSQSDKELSVRLGLGSIRLSKGWAFREPAVPDPVADPSPNRPTGAQKDHLDLLDCGGGLAMCIEVARKSVEIIEQCFG